VDDLAQMVGRVLRLVAQVEPVAEGDEEMALAVED
jgi:superfamily II DNA or RNA helicase